jgi:hypothetical protein
MKDSMQKTSNGYRMRFHDCLAFAAKLLPPEKVEGVIKIVEKLESINDVRDLIPLLIF